LDEIGVEDGAAAQVGHAIAREHVDAAATGLEAMPPDPLDDDDAGPRRVRDPRDEARGARELSTRTVSPSVMPRAAASAGASIAVAAPWRRRSRSDWLNEEFRKKRFGGTMHWSGNRIASSRLSGPSASGT